MATTSLKEVRNINYLSKDFDSIKQDLINFLQQNFPDEWQDFNEASGGMALLEMIAYVGDLMSFYIDRQANETFINRAVERKNIMGLSKTLGRKPKFVTPAVVNLSVSSVMTQASSATSLFVLNKGTRVVSNLDSSVSFEIIEDVDFSVTANRSVTSDGTFTTASISSVSAVAGRTRTFNYTVGQPTKYLKITLPDQDITEIVSLTSSDGNEWFETEYLAQDTVFIGENNNTSSSATVPYVMKMKRVPRRFVVEREPGDLTSIRFGSGKLTLEDSEVVPNPEDFVLPPTLRGSASSFSPTTINSATFLDTKTLGIAPADVSLDVTYRYGGGITTNVGSNLLTEIRERSMTFKTPNFETLYPSETETIRVNLSTSNEKQATGGHERETNEEMSENALAFFGAQNRAVTLQDYQIITMSMPSKFGTVYRTYARKDPSNKLGVEIFLAAKDSDGYVIAPQAVLKNNIETYLSRFKSFSDSIKLTDGKIVNLKVDFSIVPEPNSNANEALLEAFYILKRELDSQNSNFGDIIVLSDIESKLQSVDKIKAVSSFNITNIRNTVDGRTYSNVEFNVESNTRNKIIYLPEDCVWEIKYLNFDIVGRAI